MYRSAALFIAFGITCYVCNPSLAADVDDDPQPLSAEVSAASIQVRPGFQIELMVAEPLVMDPIAMDWGADGKLWVVEMADYPLGLDDQGQPGGRVRYLEDTDGDGRYDRSTLFLDRIAFPTGVMAWRDGVLVSAAPTVFFAADRDGDGVAEVREDLYRGFGEGNQQHRVNGFERGLDNWLYLANGDSGGTIESVKTGQTLEIRGRDLRIRPEDGAMDAQSGQTQFGRHRDDHGNWFGCSNPLPVRHYVLADHYLRRNPWVAAPSAYRDIARLDNTQLFPISRVLSHWSGYRPPAADREHEFTSACSTIVYRDHLLGDGFEANTFTCEPVHNAVHRRRLVPDGVSFESLKPDDESKMEFLASKDSWFRPTSVTTGPDGALWIADMYRLVMEHPEWIDDEQEKRLFLRAGHDRGRIYRVYPTHTPPRAMVKLTELQPSTLVDQLASPNGRIRDLAQQLLLERRQPGDLPLLKSLFRTSPDPLARLHALCTLDALQLDAEVLQVALADDHPTVRRHAIRIAERFLQDSGQASQATTERVLSALESCDRDDPHVRLQLAYSLGASTATRAAQLLAQIAATGGDDTYLRAAVISSLNEQNFRDFRTALRGTPAADQYEMPLLEMALRMESKTFLDDCLTDLLAEVHESPRSDNLQSLRTALTSIRNRKISLSPARQDSLSQLAASLRQQVSDPTQPVELRASAIPLLTLADPQLRDTVLTLVSPQHAVEIQIAAVHALIPAETAALIERFAELSPIVRSTILDDLLARESTSLELLEAIRQQVIPAHSVGASHRQNMRDHVSEAVREQARTLFSELLESRNKQVILRAYREAHPRHGNAERGQTLFTQHCASCHRVQDVGHPVGPDLRAIKDRSPQALATAILDPNAAVEDKYRSYNVLTLDGVAEVGIISDESSTGLQLTTQNGTTKALLREDIELVQSTGKSLMPEGLEKVISPTDMNHLLAFLDNHRPAPKVFPGNQPVTITATSAGTYELSAVNCRIYGDQLRFESGQQNIGYWGHLDDHVEWTVAIEQSGQYEVWIDYACPVDFAGNPFEFSCGPQSLTGTVQSTGTWEDYEQRKIGTLSLSKGTHTATFRADGQLRAWLLDLRGLTLKPLD